MPAGQREMSGLILKILILFVLALLLAIPLLMIEGAMRERKQYRDGVIQDIARGTAGEQTVTGPLLVIHYRERVSQKHSDPATQRATDVEVIEPRTLVLVPETLRIRCTAEVEERYRGIYKAQVIHARDSLLATFRLTPGYGLDKSRGVVGIEPARLVVEVSDARGLRRVPLITLDGRPVGVEPGLDSGIDGQGFSASAGDRSAGGSLAVSVALELTGTQQLSFAPVGKDTRVEMRSPWPHPSFNGGFLPESRAVGPQGFTATWQLSHFATDVEQALAEHVAGRNAPLQATCFGVAFMQPVDVYRQSERAVKYGMLFIGLTFLAFFMFEVLRRLSVHPVQYGLVGFALALFFLLVISLSEHLPFAVAYLAASAACVGLLAFYIGHVLGRPVRGAAFGAMLGALYAVLYVLLQSEDYALLLGSLLLFGVLALVMIITRRVDWYRLGEPGTAMGAGKGPGL